MRWHRGLVLVLLLSTSAGVSAQSSDEFRCWLSINLGSTH